MNPHDTRRPREAPNGASINIPEYYDRPQLAAELWILRKGTHEAICALWTHPIGGEIRIEVDGELLRSQAGRNGTSLMDLAFEWKSQFVMKGWE
jgi:hypothetical protein